MGQRDIGIRRAWRRRVGDVVLEAEAAAGAVAAKHGSLSGHSRMARRVAAFVPFYDYDEVQFFRSDDPPEQVAEQRRAGFMRLSALYRTRFAETVRQTAELADDVSDLQFTDAYRVPFNTAARCASTCGPAAVAANVRRRHGQGSGRQRILRRHRIVSVQSVRLRLLQGVRMERGQEQVSELSQVLGSYHPAIAYNVKRLKGDLPDSTKCRFTCRGPRP